MTPRKGNLMGVRTDIKVLDATIRDGGLCNNFDFSDEFVRELYKTNIKSGVDYMEFGYKASRTLFNEADFGKWKFCKEEDIRAKLCHFFTVTFTDLYTPLLAKM